MTLRRMSQQGFQWRQWSLRPLKNGWLLSSENPSGLLFLNVYVVLSVLHLVITGGGRIVKPNPRLM